MANRGQSRFSRAPARESRPGVARQVFSPDQYPWKLTIPKDEIHEIMTFPVPTKIFKQGARSWQAIDDAHISAAHAYLAGAELVGQMLQYVPMLGTNDGDEHSYNFLRQHPHMPEMQLMTPKVYPLVSLVLKHVEDVTGADMQPTRLPEHKLLASSNQLCIMITLISLDPNLRLMDLVRAVVKENGMRVPEHMAVFANEDLNAHSAIDDVVGVTFGGDEESSGGDGGGDDGGDGNPAASCEEERAPPKKSKRPAGGGSGGYKKKPPRVNRVDPLTLDETELFRQVYTLRKALSVLIDTTYGHQTGADARRMVCDAKVFSMRRTLDEQIDVEHNPEVTLDKALSLENVLRRVRTMLGDNVLSTNPQLDPTKYWCNCAVDGYPGEVECFRVPMPALTWEYEPQFLTPRAIATMEFPWATDVLRTCASVIASIYGLSIDATITCIATRQITSSVLHVALRSLGVDTPIPNDYDPTTSGVMGRAATPPGTGALHQTDVYNRIGIVGPSAYKNNNQTGSHSKEALTKGRDAPTLATAKAWNLLMNEDASGVTTMRTEFRGVGKIFQAAFSAVKTLSSAMARILQDRDRAQPTAPTTVPIIADDLFDDTPLGVLNTSALLSSSSSSSRMEDDEEMPDESGTSAHYYEDCQILRRKAVRELRQAALHEFAAMVDPAAARIQPALREVARSIRSGCSIELPFTIHSKNTGVFSNMISEITLLFKYLRIATNNIPLLILMIARDTVQMAPLLGTLSMHPYVSSAYAGGKSLMWEILERISVRWHIEYIMGSSPKGVMPVYSDPNEAPNDGVMCSYDELPTVVTQPTSKLSTDGKDVQSMMSSIMTSSRRAMTYRTIRKVGDNIQSCQICVDASYGMAGNTNTSAPSNSVVVARMVPITVAQSFVGASRNAVNFMVAHNMNKISESVVTERLQRLDLLGMLAFNAMYTGAIPAPNMDLFSAHISTMIEHLQHDRPELIQAIRILEVAHTMAGVCCVWTALATLFSGQFGEARNILDQRNGVITPEDIALITPYLHVNYEITYFVLAYAIHSATNPTSYKIMRWLAERVGGYSFVKYAKCKDRVYSRGGLPATTAKLNGQMSDIDINQDEVEAALFDGDPMPDAAFLGLFGDWYFDSCPRPSITCLDPTSKISDPVARRQNRVNIRRGPSLSANQQRTGPPSTVEEFYEMEGATVTIPLNDASTSSSKNASKEEKVAEAMAILKGDLCPEDATEYKRTPEGKELHIDPNYIFVRGSHNHFATWFAQQNQHMKLSRDNISSELDRMLGGNVMINAHLLPLIRQTENMDRVADVLTSVERYRVELMHDPRCLRRRVPVILPSSQGVYVLIEALLDSPNGLVTRILNFLCCEGTPDINIVMPFARTRAVAHMLREYSAKRVDGRVLMYSNPLHTPAAERPFLDQAILDALDLRNHTAATLKWTKTSELESIRGYFDEHGIDANPERYTFGAIQKRIMDSVRNVGTDMINEVTKAVKQFDREAKIHQQQCDANYTLMHNNATPQEILAVQEQLRVTLKVPDRYSRTATPQVPSRAPTAHNSYVQPPQKRQAMAAPQAQRPNTSTFA
jgi:hypothetical protein